MATQGATQDPYNVDYFKRNVPQQTAQLNADRLGITTDQFYQYLSQINDPNVVSRVAGTSYSPQPTTQFDPSKLNTYVKQLKAQQQQQASAQGGASGSGGTSGGTSGSYLNQGQTGTNTGSSNMSSGPTFNSWDDVGKQYGFSQSDINAYRNAGWDPNSFSQAAQQGWSLSQMLTNADAVQAQVRGPQPEQQALKQLAQIDPTSEAVRSQLGQSYLSQLNAPGLSMPGVPVKGAPSAADVQSYLNVYGQVDPTGLAGRQQLEKQLTSQAALGSQLDPETAREIEQQTRLAQTARGNVYGTPELVQEAMTRGQAGLALQQQRQQALQGFYSSGQDVGSVANQLYQQGQQNYLNQYNNYLNAWANQNQNIRANQQSALGYLTSGATPYQTASGYLGNANQNAAQAAPGGPTYNPAALGQTYTGQGAGYFPDYGLNTSQNAQGWFNSLSAYNQPYGRTGGSAGGAALGALGGAASCALAGSAAGPWGTVIGGLGGALSGGLKGYSG